MADTEYSEGSRLLELAERCEKATGPDRGLDVLIGCAVGYVPDKPGCEWARKPHWQYVPVPRISERIGCADKAGNVAAHWEAPTYTSSLDAAMTLVPEGGGFLLAASATDAKADCCTTTLGDPGAMWFPGGRAAMPALALCAAALRARAASVDTRPKGGDPAQTGAPALPSSAVAESETP